MHRNEHLIILFLYFPKFVRIYSGYVMYILINVSNPKPVLSYSPNLFIFISTE